jgi:hypothetical protein
MDLKDYLTNEKVAKKFKSQFEMVNYAIQLATNMIHTGRESRVKIDSQNRAMHVLTEILQDKDRFDEIVPKEVVVAAPIILSFDADDDDDDDDEGDEPKGKAKAASKAAKGTKAASKTASKTSTKSAAAKPATDKKKPRKILAG